MVQWPTGRFVHELICGTYLRQTGTGEEVTKGSRVNMHYIGRLAGRQGWSFENTYSNGEPFRFTLGKDRVLAGLEEGIEGMREGGRRRLIIPSKIGYVDKQIGPIPKSFSNRQRLYATGQPLPLTDVHAIYTTYNV
eukprot:12556-Heterococcus_DN1.PRE.1